MCTDDLCDAASGCYYENNTEPCEDGDPCTEPDVCSGGLCLSGPDICGGSNAALLVYMAADNNLDSYGLSDWQEMEAAGVDAADWLRVLVLIDRHSSGGWSDSRLYEVHSGSSTELDGPHLGISAGGSAEELDMADPATLSAFLQDARDITGADWSHYLVVWNHGGGWRGESMTDDPNTVLKEVCHDESSDDYLLTAELQSAVAGHGLALIGFDACLEGMAEVAYELRNDAQVMIGSEENEPGDGWEYTGLLSQFMALGAPDAVAFGQIAVDTYMDSMDYDDMTLAAFDLTALDALAVACDGMAAALDGLSDQEWSSLCRDNSLEWFGIIWWIDPYITDLAQLAARAEVVDPANAAAYQAVAAAVDQVVLYERHRSDHPNAHGLSIYFGCDGAAADYDASQIQWAADTLWDDMLHAR